MYQNLYKNLIETAKIEKRVKNSGIYYESHHIVPEFMFRIRKRKGQAGHLDGDSSAKTNIVLLTFQEHLLAHYYLYEILKNTRYEYSAGSALQFFFTKATGNHIRQRSITDIDLAFLNEMAHCRAIGIQSISRARTGKMPVVDAVTRESIGSVPVDHPNVLSGKWIHHSKGVKSRTTPPDYRGAKNPNYKEMTAERRRRVFLCVANSVDDGGIFSVNKFKTSVKNEFTEFKSISYRWVLNNFGSFQKLVDEYNISAENKIEFRLNHRSRTNNKTSTT